MYDPDLGRFLSADPNIQFAGDTQSYNRYSYVINNPLKYTDPSGYFLSGLKKALGNLTASLHGIFSRVMRYARPIFSIVFMVFAVPAGSGFAETFGAGFAASLAGSGGDIRAALVGGFTAGLFSTMHTWSKDNFNFWKMLSHGALGGVQSKLMGGDFKDGFLGSDISYSFSNIRDANGKSLYNHLGVKDAADGLKIFGRIKNMVASAIIGGMASKLTGGKFASGARSGAFSRMFNDLKIPYHYRAMFIRVTVNGKKVLIETNTIVSVNEPGVTDAEKIAMELAVIAGISEVFSGDIGEYELSINLSANDLHASVVNIEGTADELRGTYTRGRGVIVIPVVDNIGRSAAHEFGHKLGLSETILGEMHFPSQTNIMSLGQSDGIELVPE